MIACARLLADLREYDEQQEAKRQGFLSPRLLHQGAVVPSALITGEELRRRCRLACTDNDAGTALYNEIEEEYGRRFRIDHNEGLGTFFLLWGVQGIVEGMQR